MMSPPPRPRADVPPARLVLLALLVLGLLVPLAPTATALAQQQARSLDESVTAALTEAGHATPGRVHVVPAEERGDWSFGTAALLGTEEDGGPPDIVFYLAKRDGKQWRAEIESTTAYEKLLRQAPDGLVPQVFRKSGGVRSQADPQAPAWAMPAFYPDEYFLRRGPYALDTDLVRNTFDLESTTVPPPCEGGICPPTQKVVAAAFGYATTPCALGSSLGSMVVIQHEGGWRTTYYHVFIDGPGTFPKQVRGQQRIGEFDYDARKSCGGGGEFSAPRVALALSRMSPQGPRDIDLPGQTFGGWTFVVPPDSGQICLQKREQITPFQRQLATVCEGGSFWNDGSRGAGVSFTQKPNRPKRGEKVALTLANLPIAQGTSTRLAAVYYWRDPATPSGRQQRIVKTFQAATGLKKLSIKFDQPANVPLGAKLCIRYVNIPGDRGLLTCQ